MKEPVVAADPQQRRWSFVGVSAIVLLVLLLSRIWFLQSVTKDETEQIIKAVQSRIVKLVPERGRIFDVNGRVVADNKRVIVATINRQIIRGVNRGRSPEKVGAGSPVGKLRLNIRSRIHYIIPIHQK